MLLNRDFPFWESVICYSDILSYVFRLYSFFPVNDETKEAETEDFVTGKGGIFLRKKILAICDEEQDYACHFLDYLSRSGGRENFPFEVRVFTERESWEHLPKQNECIGPARFPAAV